MSTIKEKGGDTSSHTSKPVTNVSGIKVPKKYRPFITPTGEKLRDEKPPPKPRPRPPQRVNHFKGLVDAETDQPISLSVSYWNPIEGRVNCDGNAIIQMGTGKLDIAQRKGQAERAKSLPPQLAPIVDAPRHPLVDKFIKTGPLNKIHHRYWDARTDEVEYDFEPEHLEVGEEGREGGHEGDHEDGDQRSAHSAQSTSRSSIADVTTRSSSTRASTVGSLPSLLANRKNWEKYEEKIFTDLYSMASQLEINKALTGEKKLKGGLNELRKVCQNLAKKKTKFMTELNLAVQDEQEKEAKRLEAEKEMSNNRPKKLPELIKTNNIEREKAQYYITQLQTDNEIIFLTKVNESGFIW